MTKSVAASLGFVSPYGAIFEAPKPNGPAAAAGIEAGDVVTTINGTPLSKSRGLRKHHCPVCARLGHLSDNAA
jgi:serine protease Do